MSKYAPDKWVIIKTDVGGLHYRVLASWYGGFTSSDSWRISSGITLIVETEFDYEITNESGSLYVCKKTGLGMSSYTTTVFENYKDMYTNNIFEITSTSEMLLGEAEHLCKNL